MTIKNRKIFCLTEGTIRTLSREMVRDGELPKEKITAELVEKVRLSVIVEFKEWDNWLKKVIYDSAVEHS
jgi:hypothetical protein